MSAPSSSSQESKGSVKEIIARPLGNEFENNYSLWKNTAAYYIKADKAFDPMICDDDSDTEDFINFLKQEARRHGCNAFDMLKTHLRFQTLFERSIVGKKMQYEFDRLTSCNFTTSEARNRGLLHSISILEDYIDIPPMPQNLFSAFIQLAFRDL